MTQLVDDVCPLPGSIELEMLTAIEPAFASMVEKRLDGFFVCASTLSRLQRMLLAQMGLKHRLPSMFGAKDNVDAGALLSYAQDLEDLTRRTATYKILKGARPGELPLEQASKYLLAVNLKTAKALGLSISEAFLIRADAVIE